MYNNDGSSSSLEPDINPDEQEEKARLISQVLELQNTLDGNLLINTLSIRTIFGAAVQKNRSDCQAK